jgi:hypothetical protein
MAKKRARGEEERTKEEEAENESKGITADRQDK